MQYLQRLTLNNYIWIFISLTGCFLYTANELPYYLELLILILSIALMAGAALRENRKIIYLARLFLFCAIGIYAYTVKLINTNNYFSVFEFSTQNFAIARKMFALTLISVPFCWYGLILGNRLASLHSGKNDSREPARETPLCLFLIFISSATVVVFSTWLIITTSSGNILNTAYGNTIDAKSIPLGAINVLSGLAIMAMLYSAHFLRRFIFYALFFIITGFFLIRCQLLLGFRQDLASTLFTLILVFSILKNNEFILKARYVFIAVPLLFALEIFGLLRSGISQVFRGEINFSSAIKIGLGNGQYSDVVYSGTFGPIATTFSNTVDAFTVGGYTPTWGAGYADYILRLVPEFINRHRPEDYTHYFKNDYITGGGIFEIAEAFINYGAWGFFLASFFISVILSFIYRKFEISKSFTWLLLLSSFSCVFLRGAWYQTFAYVKALEIGVLALILFLLSKWGVKFISSNLRNAPKA